jgi:hypothetical protein
MSKLTEMQIYAMIQQCEATACHARTKASRTAARKRAARYRQELRERLDGLLARGEVIPAQLQEVTV